MNLPLQFRLGIVGLLLILFRGYSAEAQVQYLDLAGQRLRVPDRRFRVEQVLDGRRDRAGIGRSAGLASMPKPVELAPNLVEGLTTFLQSQLPVRPTDEPVLLLVRELRIAEQSGSPGTMTTTPTGTLFGGGTSDRALACVTLDCYLRRPDGYHFAGSATDTIGQKMMLLAVSARHAPTLARALESCLNQLSRADWASVASQPARSLEELQRVGRVDAAAVRYPIQQDLVRPRGYYRTFLEFRNNQPVLAPDLRVVEVPRQEAGWEKEPDIQPFLGTKRLPEAWGFSDGSNLYIHHRGRFARLRPEGAAFGFMSRAETNSAEQLRSGNLLGAAVAAGAASRQPVHYTLEMSGGRATLFADAGRRAARDTVRLHVYRRQARNATPVQLQLNGEVAGELPDNTILVLPWTSQTQEPRLSLVGGANPELTFIPNFRGDVYIRVRTESGPDISKPALEIVDSKTGVFQVREIKLRQGLKK